ncbi:hypothetical protein GLYMA_07G240701v4 [Glycine max]|nr:hypothetical protein GLYMA_07G240701v4 [Glycine max]KAG4401303.1 hypothetical protein GLYMA_07G240701v4 [Glycine max]KAG4401305.1 hypothetical protein GLYMA_07G240701v4 [Glycine max]KAH1088368.1 hypothetical protein GYH30_019420 [Glycine max]KAH1088370.1 hypothetical protein GYH30_019420 [Glycine max]
MQAQDYLFVRAFVPFAASVLIKAWKESDCRGDMEVILGGVASLEDEISWFKAEANKWGISLSDVVPQPPNKNYYRLLESLMSPEVEYTVAIKHFGLLKQCIKRALPTALKKAPKSHQN